VVLAALALALGIGVYWLLRPTDESRIRAQISRLEKAVRVTEADLQINPIGRLAHVSGLCQALFEPDVRVSVREIPKLRSGRQEIEQALTAAPTFVRSFDVSIDVDDVKLDEPHTSAQVEGTARASAVTRDGEARRDTRSVSFQFVKRDGEWLITTVSVWSKDDAP
jgi:uncharacterized protein (TIGR02246 family)